MKNVRLLPVVIMAVAALLVLKTFGLVTHGGYVLTGPTIARASGGGAAPAEAAPADGGDVTMPSEPTMTDASPTLDDGAPTMKEPAAAAGGGHGAPAVAASHAEPAKDGEAAVPEAAAAPVVAGAPTDPTPSGANCIAVETTLTETSPPPAPASAGGDHGAAPAEGETKAPLAVAPGAGQDCFPSGDAVPMRLNPTGGQPIPLTSTTGGSATESALLASLANRRTELETYEKDLALRASLVDAAEKRLQERQATLQALETQISTLVDQRQDMETGQFAGIVSMYENMKPRDAANIFNALEMNVLLRVAKTMNPRKMAPILAAMDPARAQELTVKMAALADQPADQMTQADLSALPQIVGQ